MNRRSLIAQAGLLALAAPGTRAAPSFPTKPIRIVVPFEPGGPSDVMVRAIGPILTRETGQSLIVENRSGAGGNIAAAYVARADKDGYTLLAGGSPTVISPYFVQGLTFDPQRDFTAIAALSASPYYIVVKADLPVHSVQDLVEMARQRPGTVTYASSGVGNRPHLAGAQFGALTGTQMIHVPYRGTAPATNDLLAGRVTFMFIGMATVREHILAGSLKMLAVCTPERDPDFPNVPTLAEAGVPSFYPSVWYGILGPTGMPEDAKQIIATVTVKALRDSDIARRYVALGAPPLIMTSAEFQEFYDAENQTWSDFFQANPDIVKDQT
jgi:tripartite-type tricarboxylate transporter receptor subunit TctC